MRTKEGVVDRLNTILSAKLPTINQIFVHAKLCERWGYEQLYGKVRARSIHAMKDADRLIGHILYLEAHPKVHRSTVLTLGATVPEQLAFDLKSEQDLLRLLNEGVRHWNDVADFTTRHLLEGMAKQTDAHIDWIEIQLGTITQLGIERYLAKQIKPGR